MQQKLVKTNCTHNDITPQTWSSLTSKTQVYQIILWKYAATLQRKHTFFIHPPPDTSLSHAVICCELRCWFQHLLS